MKLFPTAQIKNLDALTIANDPISSIDLMERASAAITDYLLEHLHAGQKIAVFAGPGNNGGDGLAVARLLSICNFEVEVYLLHAEAKLSEDCSTNLERVKKQGRVKINEISDFKFQISDCDVIIDALFGSGLSRPLEGIYAAVIAKINACNKEIISIDIPSGLFGEDNTANNPDAIIKASLTLTLQFPKLAFLLPENEDYVGEWKVLDIGINPRAIAETPTPFHFTEELDITPILKKRGNFSHKGNFGHALLIAGSYGKMGAATLAARSCLRSGAGLVTVNCPECGVNILQTAVPEAMCMPDKEHSYVSLLPEDLSPYSAIGIGCGLGQEPDTAKTLKHLLEDATQPLVLDADALNILSKHPDWLAQVPVHSIITPHPKEFERLTEAYNSRWQQINIAQAFSEKYSIFVVLKGAYTAVVCPNGDVHFNSTGNAGMATGGSGDVLCGIILSLLTQGYSAKDAAILGVYFHGKAGDSAANIKGQQALIASDIIEHLKF